MANRTAKHGMDAELAAKQAGKYDAGVETSVREFITRITGTSLPSGCEQLNAALKDGVVLCDLANKLSGNPKLCAVNKPKAGGNLMPFKQMENINNFLSALTGHFGMNVHDTFQTVDLFENTNPPQVLNCITLLSKGKTGIVSHAGAALNSDPTATTFVAGGYNKGANASGLNPGLGRQIVTDTSKK